MLNVTASCIKPIYDHLGSPRDERFSIVASIDPHTLLGPDGKPLQGKDLCDAVQRQIPSMKNNEVVVRVHIDEETLLEAIASCEE